MSELLTTARPYAKALFKTAKDQSTLDEYFEMLNNLNMVNQTRVDNSNTLEFGPDKSKVAWGRPPNV